MQQHSTLNLYIMRLFIYNLKACNMKEIIVGNWEIIAGLIGSVFAYFGGLKIQRQSVRTSELENIKTVREIEKTLLEDMKTQVDQLVEVNNYLKKVVNEQEKSINKYKQKYGEL
ncbi:hypothetical protein pippi81_gp050 [Flavobacterium phage vB_FspM_pippi8-1]|uniref:Uncharacterized protein n=1 Tax=Flavobacterium phage vB_FspM_pippi8-1 TaxID=2686244 RepID=A0A6B9LKZ9_9CAUD|nr:hypothetical protein HWC86_gp50 [Flavobacterium phage vB_FspM_pippi8-1]QHB38614.1 hypothetical protein pippi81_gp050 [Flavobacterium phage vB_FspM_pippi8-1]